MAVSYKKLWKLLIDKDMKKKELEQQAKVSHYTISKMYRGENVTIDILERIWIALLIILWSLFRMQNPTKNEMRIYVITDCSYLWQ